MIKAIIFDFGDVICFWDNILFAQQSKLSKNLPAEDMQKIFYDYFVVAHEGKYHSIEDYLTRAKPATVHSAAEIVKEFNAMEASARIDQNMVDLIRFLKKKYRIALLTNFSRGIEEYLEERFDLRHLFDVVVSSYNIGKKKPAPDVFHYTTDKLGLAADECIFIDDIAGHVEAAQKLGMRGIVYKNFQQCKMELGRMIDVEA